MLFVLLLFCVLFKTGKQEKCAKGFYQCCWTNECDSSGDIFQIRSVDMHAINTSASGSNDDLQASFIFIESGCRFDAET